MKNHVFSIPPLDLEEDSSGIGDILGYILMINSRSREFIIRIYPNRSPFFALLVGSLKNLTPA